MQQAAVTGSPVPEDPGSKAPSNARFRSFAERYVVERARLWPDGQETARSWETILQAKTIYNMIREQGRTLKDDT